MLNIQSPPLAQACSLCPIQNSPLAQACSLCPIPLRWRKLAACAQFKIQNSEFKIHTPYTLANFQSLPKLITLIINHFYSHCRGDWQIALTKQNFSDTLQFKIQNSKFIIDSPNSKFRIQNS